MDAAPPSESTDRLERGLLGIAAVWISIFACWTVLTHAVVFGGGDFDSLVRVWWLAPIVGIVLAIVLLRAPERVGAPPRIVVPAVTAEADRLSLWPILLAIPCVVVGVRGGYELFWWLSVAYLTLMLRPRGGSALAPANVPVSRPRGKGLGLVLLALIATAVTLCAHRPNFDDAGYINLAVGALDHPDWPLLRFDTLHGIEGVGVHLPTYRVHSYEVLAALLSRLTGIEPIRVFHILLPALFAPLSVATFALVYRTILPARWLAATWLTVALLCILGERPLTYGNFGYVRLFQGKALLATIAIPLVVWAAARFQREPSLRSWCWLFLIHVVAVGITANAMYVAPLATGLVLAAGWHPDLVSTKRVIAGLSAAAYPLALALYFVATHQVVGSTERQESRLLAADLTGVVGTGWQRSILFAGLLGAGAIASGATARQFWRRYAWLVLLLPLDPYLSELWARYVTGRFNWRLLWAVVLVPMAVVVILEMCARLPRWGVALFALLGIALVGWRWNQTAVARANGVEWRAPSIKVDRENYARAREIVAYANGADVLAPEAIAVWIVTFRHHPHPLVVRPHYLTYLVGQVPERELKERRTLYEYASGEARDSGSAPLFARALAERDLAVVAVPATPFAWKAEAESLLRQAGYRPERHPDADVWRKSTGSGER